MKPTFSSVQLQVNLIILPKLWIKSLWSFNSSYQKSIFALVKMAELIALLAMSKNLQLYKHLYCSMTNIRLIMAMEHCNGHELLHVTELGQSWTYNERLTDWVIILRHIRFNFGPILAQRMTIGTPWNPTIFLLLISTRSYCWLSKIFHCWLFTMF